MHIVVIRMGVEIFEEIKGNMQSRAHLGGETICEARINSRGSKIRCTCS